MNGSGKRGVTARKSSVMVLSAGVIVSGLALTTPLAGAATTRTPLPTACPAKSVVASTLKEKITQVDSATTTTSAGKAKACGYKTGPNSVTVIAFGTPVSHASFTALRKSVSKQATVVTVHGLGNYAWALKHGGGLFDLKSTLFTEISAPQTTVAELKSLDHKILKGLPKN